MNPLAAVLLLLQLLVVCGCKETADWQYAPRAAATAPSCKTPLRVAVSAFDPSPTFHPAAGTVTVIETHTTRNPSNSTQGPLVGAVFAGILLSPPYTLGLQDDKMAGNERELLTVGLYRELAASGCFAEVAFEPKDHEHYDLWFSGTTRRVGERMNAPLVPLPLWVGTLTAIPFWKDSDVLEVDVTARTSLHGVDKVVLSYGLQAICMSSDCTHVYGFFSRDMVHKGFDDFMPRLENYLSQHPQEFWEAVVRERQHASIVDLDPALPEIEREAKAVPPERRPVWDDALAQKYAMLEALRSLEEGDAQAYDATSDQRAEAVDEGGRKTALAVYQKRLEEQRKQVQQLNAATANFSSSVAKLQKSAGVSPGVGAHGESNLDRSLQKVQVTLNKVDDALNKFDSTMKKLQATLGKFQPHPAVRQQLESLAANDDSDRRRQQWLQVYRESTPTLEQLRAWKPVEQAATPAAGKRPPVAPPSAPPSGKPNCNPPYVIDAAGNHQYKPECL